MEFAHKSRARWTLFAPGSLREYLAEESAAFGELGGAMLHIPRLVDVKEVNQRNCNKVRGVWRNRTWPTHVGFMPDGRALALEGMHTSHSDHFRCASIPGPVMDYLVDAARVGGVSAVFVRSGRPMDYLLPVDELGCIAGRGSQETIWWEDLSAYRVKPGAHWWELLDE